MQLESLFWLFSTCCLKSESNNILLPEDLICHILVEYIPDQLQNRLVNKSVRDKLDKKYKGIGGGHDEGLWRREMVNMDAVLRLKSGRINCDLCEYLKSGNLKVRRMAVKLMRELEYDYSLETPVLLRLLLNSRSLEEFYAILSIGRHRNFLEFKSSLEYQNLPRSDQLTLEDKRLHLLNQNRISRHPISYCRALSFK